MSKASCKEPYHTELCWSEYAAAENARLQARVGEAERKLAEAIQIAEQLNEESVTHAEERDHYKARAERRKEALEDWADDIACPRCVGNEYSGCDYCEGSGIDWPRFRAAIGEEEK